MGRLRGCPEFGQGECLAVVRQRVLLQLADGHGGEGARQALVGVLLTWEINILKNIIYSLLACTDNKTKKQNKGLQFKKNKVIIDDGHLFAKFVMHSSAVPSFYHSVW